MPACEAFANDLRCEGNVCCTGAAFQDVGLRDGEAGWLGVGGGGRFLLERGAEEAFEAVGCGGGGDEVRY